MAEVGRPPTTLSSTASLRAVIGSDERDGCGSGRRPLRVTSSRSCRSRPAGGMPPRARARKSNALALRFHCSLCARACLRCSATRCVYEPHPSRFAEVASTFPAFRVGAKKPRRCGLDAASVAYASPLHSCRADPRSRKLPLTSGSRATSPAPVCRSRRTRRVDAQRGCLSAHRKRPAHHPVPPGSRRRRVAHRFESITECASVRVANRASASR